MALEITGKLIQKLDLQSGIGKTGNSWQKQEFIIETTEQFPRKVCANLWGDKVDMLSAINIGDTVIISFNVESREFNGKWYTDVKAWKIEKQGVQVPGGAMPVDTFEPIEDSATFVDEGSGDDLPF